MDKGGKGYYLYVSRWQSLHLAVVSMGVHGAVLSYGAVRATRTT